MKLAALIHEWFKGHGVSHYVNFDKLHADLDPYSFPVFRIRPMFAWYDLWVGIFVDRKNRQIYFFPLPMLGFQIGYQEPKP